MLSDPFTDTEHRAPTWLAALALLAVLAGVGLRAVRAWSVFLGGDGAMCGLLGLDVASGRWPVFFYGQAFMGALDGYLSAPIQALTGPSTLVIGGLGLAFALGTGVLVYLLARRLLSPRGALLALIYLALPGAVGIFHGARPNLHYPLGMLLSAAVLLLSARGGRERPLGSGAGWLWGLLAGLALWTNFQSVAVLLPCGLYMLASRRRLLRPGPLAAALAGGLAGSAPLWLFDLTHGMVHLQQEGAFAWGHLPGGLANFYLHTMPLLLGLNTPLTGGPAAPGSPWFLACLAVAGLALWGVGALLVRALEPERRAALLPVAVGLCNLALVVLSNFGSFAQDIDVRYYLPLLWMTPIYIGAALGALGRWRLLPALALLAAMVTLNLSGIQAYRGAHMLRLRGVYATTIEPAIKADMARLRAAGIKGVYKTWPAQQAYFGKQQPQVANPYRERRLYAACQVDAALDPGWWLPVQKSLAFMGVTARRRVGEVLHKVEPPPGVEQLLARGQWRSRDLAGGDLGRSLSDGDLSTGWSAPGRAAKGGGVVIDLGREQEVAGLILYSAQFRQGPSGLWLEAAGEDGVYSTVRAARGHWGPFYWSGPHPFLKARYARNDLYFPARRLRFLRLTHLGEARRRAPFSLQEVLALGPGPQATEPGWAESGRSMLALLRRTRARRVYADAWAAALVHLRLPGVRCLPANLFQNDYGEQRPDPDAPVWLDPEAGGAVVVDRRWEGAAARALADWDVVFSTEHAGRFSVLLLSGRRPGPELTPLSVRAAVNPEAAAGLARGLPPGERWSSGAPQRPEHALTVDLGRPHLVAGLELSCPDYPHDWPRSLRARASEDGQEWQDLPLVLSGPLVFAGPGLFARPGPASFYRLQKPARLRYLRLSPGRGHKRWYWSVQRLRVVGGG